MVNNLARTLGMLLDLQHSLDRARSSSWPGLATTGGGAFPLVNVFSEEDDFVIVAELPGVSKEDVGVQIRQDQIRISGTKKIIYEGDTSMHRRERASGTFDRTFTLPFLIRTDGVVARHRDGVLTVRLPRAEADQPRSISVE